MKTKTSTTQFTAKLGNHAARHGVRSRIWLEGKRLTAAGFTPGIAAFAVWTPATLTLYTSSTPDTVSNIDEQRKVSGKADRPIIDITGARVFDTFGKHGEHVSVTYGEGVITIRRAK